MPSQTPRGIRNGKVILASILWVPLHAIYFFICLISRKTEIMAEIVIQEKGKHPEQYRSECGEIPLLYLHISKVFYSKAAIYEIQRGILHSHSYVKNILLIKRSLYYIPKGKWITGKWKETAGYHMVRCKTAGPHYWKHKVISTELWPINL